MLFCFICLKFRTAKYIVCNYFRVQYVIVLDCDRFYSLLFHIFLQLAEKALLDGNEFNEVTKSYV